MGESKKQYRNPTPTVDVIIELSDDRGVVLIERQNAPFGWAIPGGFVDEGECVERAAIREAMEETSLQVTLEDVLYIYSNPKRDPRIHTMSTVFTATSVGIPVASDDAKSVGIFSLDKLPAPLCFDHAEILEDYRRFKESGERPAPMKKLARYTTSG